MKEVHFWEFGVVIKGEGGYNGAVTEIGGKGGKGIVKNRNQRAAVVVLIVCMVFFAALESVGGFRAGCRNEGGGALQSAAAVLGTIHVQSVWEKDSGLADVGMRGSGWTGETACVRGVWILCLLRKRRIRFLCAAAGWMRILRSLLCFLLKSFLY